jgi:spermidine synthase
METVDTIARHQSPRGEVLLRRRIADGQCLEELIINGAFAMDSSETSTERLLADLAVPTSRADRVLIGGLGLAYTVTAVLAKEVDAIDVVEIEQCLIEWAYQGVTAELTAAAGDPRVRLHAGDIKAVLEGASEELVGPWDAIVLDVDNGPDFLIYEHNRALYTSTGLSSAYSQLTPGGTLAIWCQHLAPQLLMLLKGIAPSANQHVIHVSRGERIFPYTIYTVSRPHETASTEHPPAVAR